MACTQGNTQHDIHVKSRPQTPSRPPPIHSSSACSLGTKLPPRLNSLYTHVCIIVSGPQPLFSPKINDRKVSGPQPLFSPKNNDRKNRRKGSVRCACIRCAHRNPRNAQLLKPYLQEHTHGFRVLTGSQ